MVVLIFIVLNVAIMYTFWTTMQFCALLIVIINYISNVKSY